MDETTNEMTCEAICQPVPGRIERCSLEPGHAGMHVGDTVTWDNRVVKRTSDTCKRVGCVRRDGHKGEHAGVSLTAAALDSGDDFGRCEARHPDDDRVRCTITARTVHAQHVNGSEVWEDFRPEPEGQCRSYHPERGIRCSSPATDHRVHQSGDVRWPDQEPLTEERVNDAMVELERRIQKRITRTQARLDRMHERVSLIEQRLLHLAVPMPEPHERGPLSDVLTRLDQVESAVNGARDVITQHVSTNTSAVMDLVNKQAADPVPVTYPFERDGMTVLGPDVFYDGARLVWNGVPYTLSVVAQPAPTLESWLCNHDGWCRLPVDHIGDHATAPNYTVVPLSQSPTAVQQVVPPSMVTNDVVSSAAVFRSKTCGEAGLGESWCKQASGHLGYCDPNPDLVTDAEGHVYDERPSNHNGQ